MYALRRWSVRNARTLERVYRTFSGLVVRLHPLLERIGYERLERPVAALERVTKGALFDCRMCGRCVLSSTGMSCPMNCPKNVRNGPCGGVRAGGFCEVEPSMRCVWVEAWEGRSRMRAAPPAAHAPVDWSLAGSSSWLRFIRESRAGSPGPHRAAGVPS